LKPRILVIRGGAIGDFILTLPALRLLREAYPAAHIEIIGYRHIVALTEGRFYADAARSIEFGPFAGFFARAGTLDEDLVEYFGSFQQVISYLFDPDGIFARNLERCGVKHFLQAHVKIDDSGHATHQLARPLEGLALYLEDAAPVVFPSEADRRFAEEFLKEQMDPLMAVHPGSGSPRKNWPLSHWRELLGTILAERGRILVVGGEADHALLDHLRTEFGSKLMIAQDLPLPALAAILQQCAQFIGHDSGISHLAASVGTQCLLLFGPTDPQVWAPVNPSVRVLCAPDGDLARLPVAEVIDALV
jgi:heptosyltransferase-2